MQINSWDFLVTTINFTLSIVFPFWPFLFLSGLLNWRGKLYDLPLRLVVVWAIFAVFRILLFFNPKPLPSFFIAEPLNTLLFFVTGGVLILIYIGVSRWRHGNLPKSIPTKRAYTSPKPTAPPKQQVVHPNISILAKRMDDALARGDYAGVLHASASIFETLAKDVVGTPTVQGQTLKGFFDRYRKDSKLPAEVLDYILKIYETRNTMPLAGHGSTQTPSIGHEQAIALSEMTKAFVKIEYKLQKKQP